MELSHNKTARFFEEILKIEINYQCVDEYDKHTSNPLITLLYNSFNSPFQLKKFLKGLYDQMNREVSNNLLNLMNSEAKHAYLKKLYLEGFDIWTAVFEDLDIFNKKGILSGNLKQLAKSEGYSLGDRIIIINLPENNYKIIDQIKWPKEFFLKECYEMQLAQISKFLGFQKQLCKIEKIELDSFIPMDIESVTEEDDLAIVENENAVANIENENYSTLSVSKNGINFRNDNKLTVPAYGLMHAYLNMYGDKAVSRANKDAIAYSYGYTSGDYLQDKFSFYLNENNRLHTHLNNLSAANAHIKRYNQILPVLKSKNTEAYNKAKTDLDLFQNNYKEKFL